MKNSRTGSCEDRQLRRGLSKLSERDSTYWEFRRQAKREGLHGLIQYPAMMVPQMQGDLLDVVLKARPDVTSAFDPFAGAGTSMTEAMARGLDFTGFDINPLAILTCKAKSEYLNSSRLLGKAEDLRKRLVLDTGTTIDVTFPGRAKWFSRSTSIHLSRIRRAIMSEPDSWARRVFWVVFAETIRQTSNSRTSTYKLHVRPAEEIVRLLRPTFIFLKELDDACRRFQFNETLLRERGLIGRSKYAGRTSLICDNITRASTQRLAGTHDLMITSPPYGDNRSTVPYGQFSFLALNWIAAGDIPGDAALFQHAYATDTASLGGRVAGTGEKMRLLGEMSPAFRTFISALQNLKRSDLEAKTISFMYDFFQATRVISKCMKPGGYLMWTLGDRTVGGISVPLVEVCREFQFYFGAKQVTAVRRRIPSKRTPVRNSIGNTMGEECLLVLRMP